MPRYRIGNALRGHVEFAADSDKDAWEKGCKLAQPAGRRATTRIVLWLDRKAPARMLPKLAAEWKQPPPTDWIGVCGGTSNEPWVDA